MEEKQHYLSCKYSKNYHRGKTNILCSAESRCVRGVCGLGLVCMCCQKNTRGPESEPETCVCVYWKQLEHIFLCLQVTHSEDTIGHCWSDPTQSLLFIHTLTHTHREWTDRLMQIHHIKRDFSAPSVPGWTLQSWTSLSAQSSWQGDTTRILS